MYDHSNTKPVHQVNLVDLEAFLVLRARNASQLKVSPIPLFIDPSQYLTIEIRKRLIANLLQDADKKGIRRCNLPYFKGMSDAQLLREAVSRLGVKVAYRCIGLKSHFLCVT